MVSIDLGLGKLELPERSLAPGSVLEIDTAEMPEEDSDALKERMVVGLSSMGYNLYVREDTTFYPVYHFLIEGRRQTQNA